MRFFLILAGILLAALPARADITGRCNAYPEDTPRVTSIAAGDYRIRGTTLHGEKVSTRAHVIRHADGTYTIRAPKMGGRATLFAPGGRFYLLRVVQKGNTCLYMPLALLKQGGFAIYSGFTASSALPGGPHQYLPSPGNKKRNAAFLHRVLDEVINGDLAYTAVPEARTRRARNR